jgi:nucleoid DNA-binding protein
MNKAQLVEMVARELDEPKVAASKAVEAVVDAIIRGTDRDGKVAISGFGTFKKKRRKARTGRNPATNEAIEIPASTTIGFTPSQALKDRMTHRGEDVGGSFEAKPAENDVASPRA